MPWLPFLPVLLQVILPFPKRGIETKGEETRE